MRNRYVQDPYLSPGFSDFGRLTWCMPEVGADRVGGRVLWGGNLKSAPQQSFLR